LSSVRAALVGFGKIAESTHLPALAQCGVEVVAIAEAAPARREQAARVLPTARVYPELASLLADEPVDLVDICTPPHLHFAAAAAAAEAGRDVLCEKPLVLRMDDAMALARLAKARAVTIACMHNWTQAPILVRARELVAQGAIGRLRRVELETLRTQPAAVATDSGNWRIDRDKAGGGILFDHGWHGMSILLRAIGSRPLAVRGRVATEKHAGLAVEDTAAVEIEFPHGVSAGFFATWAAAERKNRARVEGDRGSLEIENDRLRSPAGEERFAESLADGGYRPTWTGAVIREFLLERADPARRGRALEEAVTCLQLLQATYDSAARAGEPVTLA
jgi:predicted dehydrogenase